MGSPGQEKKKKMEHSKNLDFQTAKGKDTPTVRAPPKPSHDVSIGQIPKGCEKVST